MKLCVPLSAKKLPGWISLWTATGEHLEFAVVTGCLQIAKESIFTGLNNFKVRTVSDVRFAEYFGFTDQEVEELLDYYGM